MPAELIVITRDAREQMLMRCREVVRSGGVIAFPTDTYYGLGADPRNAQAVARLFSVKGRRSDQPLLLLLPDASMVPDWAESVPDAASSLMDRFWPGPLTLVFKARQDVLSALTGGTGRIGLRVPGNELTRDLLRSIGHGLTGTSANRSGSGPLRTAAEVARELGDRIDLILDGGVSEASAPSTVVDVTSGQPLILRRGAIDVEHPSVWRSA